MSVDVRTCGICKATIEDDASITLCPGCGRLYHDACYRSDADCTTPGCGVSAHVEAPVLPPPDASSEGSGEASTAPAAGGALERRTLTLERTALPNRVKSGEFVPQGMSFETGSGRSSVSWPQIELITLGIIEENVGDQPGSKSGLRSMVRKMFFGENQQEQQRVRKIRDVYLLDVFVRDQQQPYRIDGTTVNYRAFLGRVSYASSQNFQRLIGRIVDESVEARLDSSVIAFLGGQRDKIKRYGGVYDFELESSQNRDRLASLMARRDLTVDMVRYRARVEGDPASEETV